MKISKEEKERRYYNKKLVTDGIKTELHTPHKLNGTELALTGIGCFVGLWIDSVVDIERFVRNSFADFVIESLIVAAAIVLVKLVFYALKTVFSKRKAMKK